MKNILFISSAILICSLVCWIGCGVEELQKPTVDSELIHDEVMKKETIQEYKVSCTGPCDCALEGEAGGGEPMWVQCKCADCTMHIVFTYANGEQQVHEVAEGGMAIPYFSDFENYMAEAYAGQEYIVDGVEVVEAGEESTYTFSYSMLDGAQGNVLFAQAEKETWTVDCTGSCGCKPVFTFSTPPSASCSCDDCTMSVEHKAVVGSGSDDN